MPDFTTQWVYQYLDPETVRLRAYQLHSEGGGCMHAVSRSIIESVAKKLPDPKPEFPYQAMVYGFGGFVGQGTLCGAVNGAIAAISLFTGHDRALLHRVSREVLDWCRANELPQFVPPDGSPDDIPRNVCDSLQCTDMVMFWQRVARGVKPKPSLSERCRRLSADMAGKAAESLNAHLCNADRTTSDSP